LPTSSPTDLWATLADEATRESRLWGEALRPREERELEPIFSPLGEEQYALGIETIYEGYLLHYGRPRLFEPRDADTSLLLGDYLYAHGLERIARFEDVRVVSELAQLISLCAQLRADRAGDDGPLWAATAALLGRDALEPARSTLRLDFDAAPLRALAVDAVGEEPVVRALAAHRARLR
jgi:hypothetical protein